MAGEPDAVTQGEVELPDGGRIAYAVHGRGDATPLLLLRPLGGSSVLWGDFRARLAQRGPVISLDPRGAGRSSPPPLPVTTRAMAADARAVLAHLGITTADVFGLSLGGMVASWLAADAPLPAPVPLHLRRLVLAGSVRRGLDVSIHSVRRALSMARCLLRPSAVEMEVGLVHRVLSRLFHRRHAAEVRRIDALIRAEPASRRGLAQLAAAAALHDAGGVLGGLRMPVLLLWGDRDALVSPRAQAELCAALPHAAHARIPDAGHDVSLEQPARTAAHVAAFLVRGAEPAV